MSSGIAAADEQVLVPPALVAGDHQQSANLSAYASGGGYVTDGQSDEVKAYAARVEEISADPNVTISEIVAAWATLIEDAGGHPSQLESSLQAADAATLLRVSDAASLEEINAILMAR